jgi:hypothetical protein
MIDLQKNKVETQPEQIRQLIQTAKVARSLADEVINILRNTAPTFTGMPFVPP